MNVTRSDDHQDRPTDELALMRRELSASLALARQGSQSRALIAHNLDAITTELGRRATLRNS